MKRFGLLLIALTVLGIAIFAMMIMTKIPDDGTHGVTNAGVTTIWPDMVGNQSAIMRDRVLSVAQADPVVQKILGACNDVNGPVYIPPGKTDTYLYDNDRYAGVFYNGSAGTSYAAPMNNQSTLTVIVDVTTMKEMAVLYRGMARFMYSWVIIPPGNGVYEEMGRWYSINSPDYRELPEISSSIGSLNMTPADAMLCPIVVNEGNLTRFLNGSTYEVPALIDPDTGKTVWLNGTIPVSAGLKSTYILPPEVQPHVVHSNWTTLYYAILLNRETNIDIRIVYVYPMPVMFEY